MSFVDVLMLAATGVFAGFIGGLFGVGGGIVVVPTLYAVFKLWGVPHDVCMKMAVGTSLATIIVTSVRSVQGHHQRGNVDWVILRRWAIGIAVGAVVGAWAARYISASFLLVIFAITLAVLGIQKIWTRPNAREPGRMPSLWLQRAWAWAVGGSSSLLGVGGGVLGVVLLNRFGLSTHRSVGTAAGFGVAVAVPGAIGYIAAGQGYTDDIAGALGFVSLPAFAAVAIGSGITAPIGSAVASTLSAARLSQIFGLYMLITSVLMAAEAVRS